MKLLFQLVRRKVNSGNALQGSLDRIRNCVDRYQRKAAHWLQLRSNRLSAKSRWALFVTFVLLGFGVCIWQVVLHTSSLGTPPKLTVTRIKTPVQLEQSEKRPTILSEHTHRKLQAFKRYMDSLARSPGGKPAFDQIQANHPGLMDSINTLEILYQSQIKK